MMRSDVAEIIDKLITSDRLSEKEKEAIRVAIDDNAWVEGEWIKVNNVKELKEWLNSDDLKIESLEVRTLKNIKTGVITVQHRTPEEY